MTSDPLALILSKRLLSAALGATALLVTLPAHAVESDPLPVLEGTPREKAISAYNDGVKLMLDKRYRDAQARFEEAIAGDDKLAEAHNNLAYSLRAQGSGNNERALRHYSRALELNPNLAQALMYRGVLLHQIGESARARADYERLVALDKDLAARLEAVLKGAMRDEYYGLARQRD
jgi:tetratricopeptide (TPR) repeat protein